MAFRVGIHLALDLLMLAIIFLIVFFGIFFVIAWVAEGWGVSFGQVFDILWVIGSVLFVFVVGGLIIAGTGFNKN